MLEWIGDALRGLTRWVLSWFGITTSSESNFRELHENRWRREFRADQARQREAHEQRMARLRPPNNRKGR